jgi:broad specificity phosphatase PhoE
MALWLVRHGETEWSRSGRHTGTTDVPLTREGELQARAIGHLLAGRLFDRVLSSPMARARRTAELAGFGDRTQSSDDLREVDYGDFEGLTTDEIWQMHPGWELFRDGCPSGESPDQVRARMDRLRDELSTLEGRVVLFGHGHCLRALAIRYLGLSILTAAQMRLDTASVSILTMERDGPTVALWNRRVPSRAVLVADTSVRLGDVP